MRNFITRLTAAMLLVGSLVGCGGGGTPGSVRIDSAGQSTGAEGTATPGGAAGGSGEPAPAGGDGLPLGTSGGTDGPSAGANTSPDTGPGYASSSGTGPKTLILFDTPAGSEWQRLGLSYAIMLRNLLGHFDAAVDLVPVHLYTAGRLSQYDATFYVGAAYDTPLPATFLADAAVTSKTLVWFKYNLWQLAAIKGFQAARGFEFTDLRGLNEQPSAANPSPGFFDTITYKSKEFKKYYSWDGARNIVNSDPDVGIVAITDASKAESLVPMRNSKTNETAPYILKSGSFWYVADVPLTYIGPRDRYLVMSDMLHDILKVEHPESHIAMVRLEDVGAKVSPDAMKRLSDYLFARHVPFSIAVIPRYVDPNGKYNNGVPEDISFSRATSLRQSLDYATARGAEIVMHGYTHQYGAIDNPWTGISGDDYEFWDIVNNRPVAEDSTAWTRGRLAAGLGDLNTFGYFPVAWETPHYFCSAIACKAVPQLFSTTYQRVVYTTAEKPDFSAKPGKDFAVGQIFPYVIQRDYYGQRVLPENLGNIEYDIRSIDPSSNYTYSWQDLLINAEYALTVRDGFGSFFFHPFWVEPDLQQPGFDDFTKLVEGITRLGYSWMAPSKVH